MLSLLRKIKVLLAKAILILLILPSVALAVESQATDMKTQVKDVQKQINDLIDQGGKYVYLQIARNNGLSPFAVGRQTDGSIVMLEVPKTEEKATLQNKVLKLRQMLKLGADNDKFVAAALFVQAKVPHKGKEVDGVAIEMEHKSGISVLRFLPYEVDRSIQKINFKKPVDKIKPSVFFVKKANNEKNKLAKTN